jgi:protease-4
MAAIATDHIVARRTSITGSIGVLMEMPDVSELMKTLGIRVEEIKSAPLKAEPSPFAPISPEGRAVLDGVIHDTYDWFVDIVAERRKMARSDALTLSDGRIYTGRQALAADLVDEIGGEDEAIAWLAREKGVDGKLPVKSWAPKKPRGALWPLSSAAMVWIADKLGVSPALIGSGVLDEILPESLKLDGLLSVWQGSKEQGESPARGADE